MKINWEPIKGWFGFSRRERRSTFILLIIICLIILLRYIVPEKNIAIEYVPVIDSGIGKSPAIFKDETKAKKPMLFVKVKPDSLQKQERRTYNHQKKLLEINSSDSASFVSLPGIGPVLASRIIKYRHLLGGFARVDQLKDVYGLPVETYDLIKERLIVDTLVISRININSADYKALVRLPYIEKFEVTAILKYRELKGNISRINELTENKLIGAEKVAKMRPYLKFE